MFVAKQELFLDEKLTNATNTYFLIKYIISNKIR